MKARTKTFLPLVAIMRSISRNFVRGEGPGSTARKQPGQRFYFSSQLILQFTDGDLMILLQRKLYFSKDPERGSNIFRGGGGPTFSRGKMHITCDFPGGVQTPFPLWIRTWPC